MGSVSRRGHVGRPIHNKKLAEKHHKGHCRTSQQIRRWQGGLKMVPYFNPDPSAPGTKYYQIEIDDPELTKYGFSRFKLPINGNAAKMILDNNKDRSLITYVDFDRTSLDNSVKLLQDKLLDEQIVEDKAGKDTVTGLVAYFRNECICRIQDQDPDFDFFKNGNGKSKSHK